MERLVSRFDGLIAEYDALYCTVDPETAPYHSKYAARALMVSCELRSGRGKAAYSIYYVT